ncbi:cytomegalovirus gH-receptor family protein, putative [Paecilomyces variotii No. 5]|uniref:Cytomegalovirus gH-receptor family protein, putative n=1 Tax=Byssochlamys spectabilis (strain No. 5 / NBRC 109023) TaxID=1356009 RepID=V5FIJ5_BYSSN|nr:cytomegalovirus gH-receptor family protein, putative [Paecilomyces variotii No. 5]
MPLSNKPGVAGAVTRFWQRSYASDYISLGFLAAGWVLIQITVKPFHQMFTLDNVSIQHPFAVVERVPVLWSIIYAGIIPLLIIFAWASTFRPDAHKFHITVLGLLVTLTLSSFITDVIKNAVGRPRPDLISRCKPEKGTAEHLLVTFKVCTQTNLHILDEGWRSFPSGHSSFSFGGLGYLSLYVVNYPQADFDANDPGDFAELQRAAQLSSAAYSGCQNQAFDVTITKQLDDSDTGTQGFVGYSTTKGRISVVMRGSTSLTDFANDLDVDKTTPTLSGVSFPSGVEVMKGVYDPWSSVHDTVISAVKDLVQQYPNYTLESTGHSLGGSLTYLSYIALAQNFPDKAITSNALAAFPIGNQAFADFGSTIKGTLRRGNNLNDGVPNMYVDWPFDMVHYGTEIYSSGTADTTYLCLGERDEACSAGDGEWGPTIPGHIDSFGITMLLAGCGHMIASSKSPSPLPSFTQHRKENRSTRPPPPDLCLESDSDFEPSKDYLESIKGRALATVVEDARNGGKMTAHLQAQSQQTGMQSPRDRNTHDAVQPDGRNTVHVDVDKLEREAALQSTGTALGDLMTPSDSDSASVAGEDNITIGKRRREAHGHSPGDRGRSMNVDTETPGASRKLSGGNNGPSVAQERTDAEGLSTENASALGLGIVSPNLETNGVEAGAVPLLQDGHISNGSSSRSRRESSPRRTHEKEKVLKLSPEKIQELTSSPESIPYRKVPPDDRGHGELHNMPSLPSRTVQYGSQGEHAPSKRPLEELRTPDNRAPRSKARKEIHLDEPPEFFTSIAQSSSTVRHRPHTARTISTPASTRQRTSSVSNDRLGHSWTQRSKHDRPAPNRIEIEHKSHLPSHIADPNPSPMPQTIPLPPLSIPTYLQLELSSSRPSPLYIHRSIASDFPYESSRVKIERLQNFFMLPPILEQVLWFGALACLDSWLYSFTILPLRFIKAIYILAHSWAVNVCAEIQFISGFVIKGVGRVWRRRREAASAKSSEQRGREEEPGSRSISASSTKQESSLSDRDAKRRPSIPQADHIRRIGRPGNLRHRRQKSIPSALLPDDKADILKGLLMIATCCVLMFFDASRVYHWIRGQAAIKLYVIYNVLEVSDRLLSAIGQDVLECLFSREALERKPDGRSKVFRPFWLFLIALAYTVIHAISLFYQAITLNVAVNSYSNALITLLLSNQFVEIKSTVFKKFEKENLFQLTCADVVERFQLWLMLIIIASRNIIETRAFNFFGTIGPGFGNGPSASTNSTPVSTPPRSSSSILPQSFTIFPSSLFASLSGANSFFGNLGQLLGPFLVVLGSEMLVDWLKHAYINKFNNTRPAIYNRFLDVLAKDYYTNAFADQNLTRRLGLPVIPLSCLFFRVSVQTYQMFLTAWLPQLPPSTPSDTTSLSSIHRHYAPAPSTSAAPFTLKTAFPNAISHITSFFQSVIANATPSPARSVPVFTIIIVVTCYAVLLIFKLALGILLLSFARSRYKAMKVKEQEELYRSAINAGQKSSQGSAPSSSRAREFVVEGGKRVGGWGVVEVDDDKKRWIYADDPEGLKKVRDREERDKSGKDTGGDIEGVKRYEMVAKRIW